MTRQEVTGDAVASDQHAPITAVPVRHPGRWVAVVVVLVLLAMLVHSLATNPGFQWTTFGQYFFSSAILRGIVLTLELTVISMFMGVVIGVVLAVMRLSPNPVVASAAWLYVWFFRGTPVLVQLLFWSFFSVLYKRVSLGVPFGPDFISFQGNLPLFVAAILGLGLNEGAYMSEIVRAGIISVDEGQSEAAAALGMSRMRTMGRIVLPQAMRVIIPPTGNETISMLKTTSLVSVIALSELLYSAQIIYSRNYQQIPLLLVASVWYIAITSILSVGQFYLERYFARGSAQQQRATMLERLARGVLPSRRPNPADAGIGAAVTGPQSPRGGGGSTGAGL